ncbi:hypothetical protein M769_0105045 [Bacillus haynesii]|nr:hypothetical protein M769_0105045 [Bacillus haynesii]
MHAHILSRTTFIFKTRRFILRGGIERAEKRNILFIVRNGLKTVLKNQFEYKFAMEKRQEFMERLENLLLAVNRDKCCTEAFDAIMRIERNVVSTFICHDRIN